MDSIAASLDHAHQLYARAGGAVAGAGERPPAFKAIGIGLAVGSGAFIGTSFVLKKVGLLKANEKYNEVAGEGYGYLKNAYWWAGMILMILGEGLNFAAYAFTDAILVTPLGALSVVITTILSAIFLKERLSMVGKVACFLCIVGSVVIVLNAPTSSAVANIEEMQAFVLHPLFLTYTGVVIVGAFIAAFWLGPKYGSKNMLVYISICSWVGGLSVVATQGLGAAIIAQAGGRPQFNQWFLYVLLAFVIATLLTEIIYLNVRFAGISFLFSLPLPPANNGSESSQYLQRRPRHAHILCLLH
jgi:drug/metabolite transporter (DMT)-like permease